MERRYVCLWFRYLKTDWFSRPQPELKAHPFVLRTLVHGRMVLAAVNAPAQRQGLVEGMALADARAMLPHLRVMDDRPDLAVPLLKRLAGWCIRYTPLAGIQPSDGLVLDATGCAYLWGGEEAYLKDIVQRLMARGYEVRAAMADTIGAAWAVARFDKQRTIIPPDGQQVALQPLPPEALRLEADMAARLHTLGLHQIQQFMSMPRSALRRRFGVGLLHQLDKTLGYEIESFEPVIPPEPYCERLPCLEPIVTATGIEIALRELLTRLCTRLRAEQKGVRKAVLTCFRVDGHRQQLSIGTNHPSVQADHLFKLFALHISSVAPGLGIELFMLEAPVVEPHRGEQEALWRAHSPWDDEQLAALLDRISTKAGPETIHRYVAAEHYWPERSIRQSSSLQEESAADWRVEKLRPLHLLSSPEPIEVTAPIPDYPPLLFRYRGKVHQIAKADGPERIEQEWWIQQGQHRDYYRVEDEAGCRYWIFRLGHYHDPHYQWFLHGFFA